MKKIIALLAIALAVQVRADVYNDATGDLDGAPGDDFSGFTHLDINQVTISNDLSNIYFAITTVQNPINSPTDWGNYMIGIDSVAGGDTAANGNGWARPINMSAGMDYWIGSWVNTGGGAQLWNYTGATWNGPVAATHSLGAGINITIPLASLGLSVGNTFAFDVYSSGGGGGDSAVDALSSATPSITSWGGPFTTGAGALQYTVVPEPSTMALIGIAGALLAARRMRRS